MPVEPVDRGTGRDQRAGEPARLIAVAVVLMILAVPLSLAARGPGLLPGDVAVARAIQKANVPGADAAARTLSWIGQGFPQVAVLTVVAVLVLLRIGLRPEAALLTAAAVARLLGSALKVVIASPRPTPDVLLVRELATGYGFPSGHAFGAVLFYGALAAIVPSVVRATWAQRLLQAAAVLLIVATGLARVRVGAHWPSDVLGGYLWGGCVLALLMAGFRAARSRLDPRRRA